MRLEKAFDITDEVMQSINRFAVEPLTPEQVYCFSVNLCDNDIDRDFERFSDESLQELAKLFVGRTGIFDHDPKGAKQTARIFDAGVEDIGGRLTRDGKPYKVLRAKAYMVRTSANADLIREISGGIKKEVSVSCSVAKQVCSVCGSDRSKSACSHVKGKSYGGKLCFATLEGPTDAYEWSFVAVPAQVGAGVTKRFEARREESKQLRECRSELAQASKELNKAIEGLKGEILRLSYFCKPYYTSQQVTELTKDMDVSRLLELKQQLREHMIRHSDELDEQERSFVTAVETPEQNNDYTI